MKPCLTNVPVLLIFFCRDEQFRKVFEQVKNARPRKLFLYQDGPRPDMASDVDGIKRCREIAEDIDWECEVHKLYQESNKGCDPSGYIAQRWAFSNVDRCIVLEDDCVPCQSFFPFCEELLEKYKDDERINMICGYNHLGTVDTPYDYLFAENGSIWGWASWKRVVDRWDPNCTFLDDQYTVRLIKQKKTTILGYSGHFLEFCMRCKSAGISYHEAANYSSAELNGRINIVASKNMISNIGIAAESTHDADSVHKLPKAVRKLYFSPVYDISKPIKHPKYVIRDKAFDDAVFKMLGLSGPLSKWIRYAELLLLSLRYKGIKATLEKVKKTLR